MKDTTCKYCKAVNQHYSFKCFKNPKNIKSQADNVNGSFAVVQRLKSKKIAPISDKQKKRLVKYHKLRLEHLNTFPKCQARLDGCSCSATEIHHKKGRDGDNLFKYFLAVCRNCHNIIGVMGLVDGIEQGFLMRRTEN